MVIAATEFSSTVGRIAKEGVFLLNEILVSVSAHLSDASWERL